MKIYNDFNGTMSKLFMGDVYGRAVMDPYKIKLLGYDNHVISTLNVKTELFEADTPAIEFLAMVARNSWKVTFSKSLHNAIKGLKDVVNKLSDYRFITFMRYDGADCLGIINGFSFNGWGVIIPVHNELLLKLAGLGTDCLNEFSNRYLIDLLITDLGNNIERIEYYEQEISKSEN